MADPRPAAQRPRQPRRDRHRPRRAADPSAGRRDWPCAASCRSRQPRPAVARRLGSGRQHPVRRRWREQTIAVHCLGSRPPDAPPLPGLIAALRANCAADIAEVSAGSGYGTDADLAPPAQRHIGGDVALGRVRHADIALGRKAHIFGRSLAATAIRLSRAGRRGRQPPARSDRRVHRRPEPGSRVVPSIPVRRRRKHRERPGDDLHGPRAGETRQSQPPRRQMPPACPRARLRKPCYALFSGTGC